MVDIVCNQCNKVKDSTFDFYWSRGERQRRCKECMKAYSTSWYRDKSDRLKKIKALENERLAPRSGEKDAT